MIPAEPASGVPSMTIITREQVAERLHIPPTLLARYEARGLVRSVCQGAVEGYEPSEIRRVWSVVSLHRDLGINLAGIEAILRLRDQLRDVHAQLAELAEALKAAAERDDERDP